jgi:TPR repeat protein
MPKRRPDVDEKRREIVEQLTLAEEGDAATQNALAAKLAQGYFVKRNLVAALYWYGQAVKQGYTHAKWNAGTMLIEGEGVSSKHVNLGMVLIEQAASSGDASACNFLAQCYERGAYGMPQDPSVSEKWRQSAQDDSHFVEYGAPFDIEAHGVALTKSPLEWP